jgi:hypothetical protein
MPMRIVEQPITRAELGEIAASSFGDMVKAAVDVVRGSMAIGGELHADEEALLLAAGSAQENVWGINLYPAVADESWIEFDSMINVRPSLGNRSRSVEDEQTRTEIIRIVTELVR